MVITPALIVFVLAFISVEGNVASHPRRFAGKLNAF